MSEQRHIFGQYFNSIIDMEVDTKQSLVAHYIYNKLQLSW